MKKNKKTNIILCVESKFVNIRVCPTDNRGFTHKDVTFIPPFTLWLR